MSAAVNGGPAFPCPEDADKWGMNLRDYFAAKAMVGLISTGESHDEIIDWLGGTDDEPTTDKLVARVSYFLADAMLAERAK